MGLVGCLERQCYTAMYQGSRDNMSVVIVAFEGAPKVSDEAKEKEAELDTRLELKVKGLSSCEISLM